MGLDRALHTWNSRESVPGKAYLVETFIDVHWPWIILPGRIALGSLVLFLATAPASQGSSIWMLCFEKARCFHCWWATSKLSPSMKLRLYGMWIMCTICRRKFMSRWIRVEVSCICWKVDMPSLRLVNDHDYLDIRYILTSRTASTLIKEHWRM